MKMKRASGISSSLWGLYPSHSTLRLALYFGSATIAMLILYNLN
jgi:hypothetical protein